MLEGRIAVEKIKFKSVTKDNLIITTFDESVVVYRGDEIITEMEITTNGLEIVEIFLRRGEENKMPSLIEGLQKEMNRCRELLKAYEEIPQGAFGASMIKLEISQAEASIADGDTVAMVRCFKSLEEITG